MDQRSQNVRSYAEVGTVRRYPHRATSALMDGARPPRPEPGDGGHKPLVILVNRDRDTRLIFGSILERHGYAVSIIDSVESGVRFARRRRAALVIADSVAHGPDGEPLSMTLRGDRRTFDVALITLTTEPMPRELQELEEDDRARCLAVPVSPGRLLREVRMLIGPAPLADADPASDSGSAA